jgi:hypothetical protein
MNKKLKITLWTSGTILLLALLFVVYMVFVLKSWNLSGITKGTVDFYKEGDDEALQDQMLLKFLDSVDVSSEKYDKILKGEKLRILITGIDSRLGSTKNHADATHLITVWFEPGIVEIVSIPRGTWADAGFKEPFIDSVREVNPDAKLYSQNYLANVRATRGRLRYWKDVRRIAKVDSINYYVEFGFSQAIGLLELMGYGEKAPQVLRVLRTRQVYGGQEHQRNFNQGQFIKQMILAIFPKLESIEGEILMRSALLMVDTDLDIDAIKSIIERLKAKGFPRGGEAIIQRVKPKYGHKYLSYDFGQSDAVDSLYKYLATKSMRLARDKNINDNTTTTSKVKRAIDSLLSDSEKYVTTDPSRSIRNLRIPFEQRAWFQIADIKERSAIRRRVCNILIRAYKENQDNLHASEVQTVLDMEERVFNRLNNR